MKKTEIISQLIALKRKEITQYKSSPAKETLIYENNNHGRFVLWSDIQKIINQKIE